MAKRGASTDLQIFGSEKRLRYDTLSTVRNDSLELEEFWPYQDYENLSFSYLDFLKDDIISPALENSTNSNSTISTTDNFPIFNTDPTPQQSPLVNYRTNQTKDFGFDDSSNSSRVPFQSVENIYQKNPPLSQIVLNQYEPIRDQIHLALQPSTSPPTQKTIRTRVVQMPTNNFNNHIQHSVQSNQVTTNQISNHRSTNQNNSNRYHDPPQQQMNQNGSGTSFEPILYKIIRQKSTGTNSGVFFYFKIYDKIYRGRRDSFSKDKTIMYLRCNTCPRSVNKDTCKWRAKIRLLKDPDAMIANPELMRIENFCVIPNPKGHHHSYHCQQMNLDPDTLHKK